MRDDWLCFSILKPNLIGVSLSCKIEKIVKIPKGAILTNHCTDGHKGKSKHFLKNFFQMKNKYPNGPPYLTRNLMLLQLLTNALFSKKYFSLIDNLGGL